MFDRFQSYLRPKVRMELLFQLFKCQYLWNEAISAVFGPSYAILKGHQIWYYKNGELSFEYYRDLTAFSGMYTLHIVKLMGRMVVNALFVVLIPPPSISFTRHLWTLSNAI